MNAVNQQVVSQFGSFSIFAIHEDCQQGDGGAQEDQPVILQPEVCDSRQKEQEAADDQTDDAAGNQDQKQ